MLISKKLQIYFYNKCNKYFSDPDPPITLVLNAFNVVAGKNTKAGMKIN